MVYPNYDLFDFEYSQKVSLSIRPDNSDTEGLLSSDQDEVHLMDSVLRYRDRLIRTLENIEDVFHAAEMIEVDNQRKFLFSLIRYLGIIPGSLTSIWGTTGPDDWKLTAKVVKSYSVACKAEADRARSYAISHELQPNESYVNLIEKSGYLLRLVAEHFKQSASNSEKYWHAN